MAKREVGRGGGGGSGWTSARVNVVDLNFGTIRAMPSQSQIFEIAVFRRYMKYYTSPESFRIRISQSEIS